VIAPPPLPEEESYDDFEWEGSGLDQNSVDALINKLYISLLSIIAGNTSLKARKEAFGILEQLHKQRVLK